MKTAEIPLSTTRQPLALARQRVARPPFSPDARFAADCNNARWYLR